MMSTSRRRLSLGFLGALALVMVALSCTDDTGPVSPVEARFGVAPVFQTAAASVIDVARIRFLLTRTADGTVAKDTVIDIAVGQDSVDLALTVPIMTPGETFQLVLAMVDAAGDTVFRGGPTEVTPTTGGGQGPVVQVPIQYVGTGFNASSVQITSADTATFFGEAVQLSAVALDSVGMPIPGTPIVWSTLNPLRASVPNPDSGRVVGGTARGDAQIVAELLTGPKDTATVTVQPVPNSIVADQGNNQAAPGGAPLAQPIVARVLAADGLGVANVYVRFQVTAGGGSLSVDSALTGADGRASTQWTLGLPVTQTVTASTARLPATTAVFSATALGTRATQLVLQGGDAQADTVAATLAQALTVQALDQAANPFPGDTVVFAVTAGAGTVTLDTVITDGTGMASTTWTLGTGAGIQQVEARLISDADTVTFTATANPGTATQLAFIGDPVNAFPFDTIAGLVIAASDQFFNLATGFNGTVDLSLATNPAGGTLMGTTSRPAVAGQITFDDVSIDNIGTGYALDVTSAGLAGDTSVTFDILVPPGGVYWINAAGGDWSTAANWSTGQVPSTQDTANVTLNGTYTVTVDVTDSIAVLNFGGTSGVQTFDLDGPTLTIDSSATFSASSVFALGAGALQGQATVSIFGTFLWSGGQLLEAGVTRVEAGGILTLTGGTKTLNTRTLANAGTATWDFGLISAGNGGTFVNEPGATFDLQADDTFDWAFGATSVFDNQGTFTRTVGVGTAFIDGVFNNSGSADHQTGTLQLGGGGTQTGTFTTQPTTTLTFGGGTHVLDVASNFTGNGAVEFTGGQVDVDGAFTIGSPLLLTGSTLNINSATATTDVFTQIGGTLSGTGILSVTSTFTWSGGTQFGTGTGTTRLEAGGTLTINTTSTKSLDGRTVENLGTATWVEGFIGGGNGGTFINGVGATFDAQADNTFDWGFGATTVFDNQGTFTRTVGTGTAFIDGAFDNTGSADVQSGTLSLRNGGTSTGAFTVQATATLEFAGGTHNLNAGSDVSGAGTVRTTSGTAAVLGTYGVTGLTEVAGGTLNFSSASTSTTANLTQTGGTLEGSGTLSVTATFTWSSGSQNQGGTTRVEAGGTLLINTTSGKTLNTRTVENLGTATWTDGFINGGNGGTFVNGVGGTFDAQTNNTFDWGFGITSIFDNQGTFTRTVGTGTLFIDGAFQQTGTVDVQTGTLSLRNGGNQSGATTVQAGAVLDFAGGIHSLVAGSSVTGAGTVRSTSGTTTFFGTYAITTLTEVFGGTLNFSAVAAGTTLDLTQTGGTVGGTGTLSITGTFLWSGGTQQDAGITRIESGATATLTGTTKTLSFRTIENAGTATHDAGVISGGNGGTWVTEVGGVYDMTGSVTFDWAFGATSVFDNQGTFTNSGTTSFMDAVFNHTGTTFDVAVTATLQLRNGGTLDAAATTSGTLQFTTGTFTLTDNFDVTGTGTVLLSSATITVNSPDIVNFDNFTQSGGTLNGDGNVGILGTFTWTGGTQTGTGVTSIENTGTASFTGGTKTLDSRSMVNHAILTHDAGAVNGGNSGTFINDTDGTYNMTASVTFDWGFGATSVFDNRGSFSNDGTNSFMDAQLLHTGTGFDATAGSLLQMRNGGTLDAPMTTSGTLQLAGGTFTLLDNFAVTGTGTTVLSTGTATVASPDIVDFVNFTQSGGTVTGDGQVSITGTWTWTGGTQLGTGLTRLEATGTGTLTGGTKTLDTRTVQNAGTVTHNSGAVNGGNSGTWVNEVGGTYDMTASVTFDWGFGATSVFDNQGDFSNDGTNSFMDAQVLHTGTGFDATPGSLLQMRGGGTLDAPMTTSGTLQFNGGTFTLLDNFAVTGTGIAQLSTGTATVTSPDIVDFVNFTQSGGTMTGDGQVSITGTWTWTGGTQLGTGTTRLETTGTGSFSGGTKTLDTRTIENAGSVTHNSGSVNGGNGGTLINEVGAVYDMDAPVTFDWGFGATSVFNNQGTLSRTTVVGTSFMDAAFFNTGVLDLQTGTIDFRNTFDFASGATIQGSGTFSLTSATVSAFDGDINPGTSPGILTLVGNVTQGASSTINIEIFGTGTTPGVDFDQLAITGTATLNGTINLIVSAAPGLGDSLPIITHGARAGTLAALFAPPQQSGIVGDSVGTSTAFSVVVRSQILFAGDNGVTDGVFRVSRDGTSLTNVTTEGPAFADDYFARWAPDRTRMAYSANDAPPPYLLHVTSWDGLQIAHPVNDTNTTRARFSLTGGGQLRLGFGCGDQFFSRFNNAADVCTVADVSGAIPSLEGIGDGAGKVFVTDAVDAQLSGSTAFAWNPTNPDQLAVVRDSVIGPFNRNASQMWFVNFDGTGVAELTPNVIIDGADTLRVEYMDWSPDGSFIAFSAFNQSFVSSIYRVETATGVVTRVTTPPGGDDDELPIISPDGSTILFIRNGFGAEATNWDLFTVPAGGGAVTQVTAEFMSVFFGLQSIRYDWSPDGSEIVLAGSDGANPGVYVIPSNTTSANYLAVRVLVSRAASTDIQPSWRP